MDLEGDGPQAAESLRKLLGGDIATMGHSSTRGGHNFFVVDTPDGERFLGLLVEAKAEALKGEGKAGVWKLPEFPDLEFRIGGFKKDQTVKQCQSVVPPTIGDNGLAREWSGSDRAGGITRSGFHRDRTNRGTEASRGQAHSGSKQRTYAIRLAYDRREWPHGRGASNRLLGQVRAGGIRPAGPRQGIQGSLTIGPGFDLPPETAFRLLWDQYNPQCTPPWNEQELRHKVDDAYQVETRRGWLRDANKVSSSSSGQTLHRPVCPHRKRQSQTLTTWRFSTGGPQARRCGILRCRRRYRPACRSDTEADPVATLVQVLAAFGNMIGRTCFFSWGNPPLLEPVHCTGRLDRSGTERNLVGRRTLDDGGGRPPVVDPLHR